ncbi:PXA domain-containingprotein [Purpureocillium lavendulum]|uniref:PXA domain-containingprotein n=1 Tax=Purpureocillium lavendulum TaxID=1247861 RepID=A0AB34G737_9HYPO|nr:PXA domain-containingprotein [Purpureocillium lavendulum]
MSASAVSSASPAAPAAPPARAGTPRLRQPASGNALAPGGDRRANRPAPVDPLSDRATQALIRRVLCAQQSGDKGRDAQTPIDELLPPLTSRNDVDLQLYAFLAIILREFVQTWYGKITTDEAFVAEIIHTIAHCTRALEQRLRKLDLESLVFNEIPEVIDKHVSTYRTAHRPSVQPPLVVDPREAFHALWPLPFLSPVPRPEDDPEAAKQQLENEAAYRQLLVQAVLAVLLPTEDLENPCLTALVGQIFSELIIGNLIGNKTTQPWLLFECICILARVIEEKKDRTAQRIVSGSGPGPQAHGGESPLKQRCGWSIQGLFLWIIQLAFVFMASIRLLAGAIAMSTSLPPRRFNQDPDRPSRNQSSKSGHPEASTAVKAPILEFSIWRCVGNVVEVQSRMPWLGGILSLLQLGATRGPGRIAGVNSTLDRLLSRQIQNLFSAAHLSPVLRSLRGVLFPNNAPGTPSLFPPSSDAELRALRRRAARSLWALVPRGVARVYLCGRLVSSTPSRAPPAAAAGGGGGGGGGGSGGGDGGGVEERDEDAERMVDEVEGLLMVLGDDYCNKHLLYSVLELILLRLMPELSEKGVVELWDERLG